MRHGDRTVAAAAGWKHVGVWAQIARVSSFSRDTQTLKLFIHSFFFFLITPGPIQ